MPFPKICKGCGVPFVADRRSRDFHTRSCFATWRETTPAWQAARRRGQLKSAATGRKKAVAIYERTVAACTSKGQAFREGRRDGYRLGWKRGARVGFANGYEQALQDMEIRRSA